MQTRCLEPVVSDLVVICFCLFHCQLTPNVSLLDLAPCIKTIPNVLLRRCRALLPPSLLAIYLFSRDLRIFSRRPPFLRHTRRCETENN